jgi:putative aldouronate transport system permease protein
VPAVDCGRFVRLVSALLSFPPVFHDDDRVHDVFPRRHHSKLLADQAARVDEHINFFKQIPSEVREAAVIDGASDITIFLQIVIPLSKPVIATVALFLAVMFWNDWFSPYLYVNDTNKYTLPLILKKYVANSETDGLSGFIRSTNRQVLPEQVKSTVILVAILPTLIIYPFIQKYFVKGVTLGSLKG